MVMEVKVALLIFAFISLEMIVDAELFYNPMLMTNAQLEEHGLKCYPGHTVIKIEEKSLITNDENSEEETRRSHMNAEAKEESCKICVCSTDGKDEYCSRRPARNVNECLRMGTLKKNMERNLPFAHERSLAFRIRRVGDESGDAKCIPFVSQYSDCSEANSCSGCNRCSCSAEGEWQCESVFDCSVDDEDVLSDRQTFSTAVDVMFTELKKKAKKKTQSQLVPDPPKTGDELLVPDVNRYEEDFATYMSRQKRSVDERSGDKKNKNHTISFYHTGDDINEDTLRGTNHTGTISASKVDMKSMPKISRRTDIIDHFNKSDISPLQIEYNPQDYDHHITENKIESTPQAQDLNHLNNGKLRNIIGNYSQSMKNKDLSKLVVTELKHGTEVIGDKNVPPMSNITFTPENDTLTAMTYIAGNLLTKLWDMEKESTDASIEVESMKHKKINDLLELFKEPLSIRQETFLKNALKKLSDTLNRNKNTKNVSFCETIAEKDISSDENTNIKETHNITMTNCRKAKMDKKQEEKETTTDVISKLNNVLSLMKKFEQVQNSIKDLKHHTLNVQPDELDINSGGGTASAEMKNVENSSLNLFGHLLEKITKLLIPNNASKKYTSKIKNLNQFNGKDNVKGVIEDKFKIDLRNTNMTIKDKLIFDYLNHIRNNPNCLLSQIQENKDERNINIEGDILYNLSDFFRIKSLFDLIKLTKPETERTQAISTAETYKEESAAKVVLRDTTSNVTNNVSQKINITKEKLKGHLKAIIDDLLELQNENDPKSKSKINILDALPCIYNILNADKLNNDKNTKKKVDSDPLSKIKKLIDSLKIELTSNTLTRRNNVVSTERPHSAKVLERILRNVNKDLIPTRRNFNYKRPKTLEELKNIMEKIELSSNSYKNFALLAVIPPQKRLMLLKTLEADTKQSILALKNIKDSLDTISKLPVYKQNDFEEFIDNAENNINLSVKVLNNLGKSMQKNNAKDMVEVFAPDKYEAINRQTVQMADTNPELDTNYKNNDIKLTRDQILSILIENRIKLYLATKEATNADLTDDINYNIGKRIISLLRQGNVIVAKELFKVFIANKREGLKGDPASITANNVKVKSPLLMALKEPLIRFDNNAKKMQLKTPELLFTQLLNLKKIT
ncbi:uncharacterized protein LOC126777026 isoform X2 [Nymphalis io]|uniref:uncharacterized protein LOC126777026 isoform X2 n=1 Tax=Inachis io TaxID=171585 RepID=UPI0021697A18|nr:uncharacterized protein LOC126777026 isoform X2 [Nymphalis io]